MKASRGPRAPGLTLAAVAAALLVAVAAIALTARATPPPTVSELAPQAVRQITETQKELGGGPGTVGAGGLPNPPPPPAIPSPIEVARVKHCIGDPPRQIEDPQSPPCVPYWKGDNGGATWKGVTGGEIRVAVANYERVETENRLRRTAAEPAAYDTMIKLYETFFNQRFEFYGRKLNLIPFTPARHAATAVEMRADAVKVDDELHAFAATGYSEQDGRQYVYFDSLAARRVLGILMGPGGMSRVDEAHLRRYAPYEWDYTTSADRFFEGYGQFICNVLTHKPPIYAAPPESQSRERKFGIIVDTEFHDTPPFDIGPLRRTLASCNTPLVAVEWDANSPATTALLALHDKGVTSVMYTGQTGILALHMMPQADSQGFHPEWLVWNLGNQDNDEAAWYFPKSQLPHVLGTQVLNKSLRPADMPHVWAAKEIDPTYSSPSGQAPIGIEYERLYKSLLLLASGIQMAGPHLTPETLEQGLMRTAFPNPGADGPPYYQARVGFPGVHTMQQSMAMVWTSASERSPYTRQVPTYCYVRRGQRYGLGQWLRQNPQFFQGPCR